MVCYWFLYSRDWIKNLSHADKHVFRDHSTALLLRCHNSGHLGMPCQLPMMTESLNRGDKSTITCFIQGSWYNHNEAIKTFWVASAGITARGRNHVIPLIFTANNNADFEDTNSGSDDRLAWNPLIPNHFYHYKYFYNNWLRRTPLEGYLFCLISYS